MLNYNDKLYLLSSIETIIKGNDTVNLDNYILEFDLRPINYVPSARALRYAYDSGIMLSVKVRRKSDSNIEYSKVFFKTMKEKSSDKELNQKLFDCFINSSDDIKLDFIISPENTINNKLYQKGRVEEKVDFLDELIDEKTGITFIGGRLSKTAKTEIDSKMNSCEYNEAIVYKMTM